MKNLFSIVIVSFIVATAAHAQVTDPNLNCEQYMKMSADMGPTPKTGDAAMDKMAADIDAKMAAYCKANPKAKAMEAAEKIMMGN
jgi:hypothetical protein